MVSVTEVVRVYTCVSRMYDREGTGHEMYCTCRAPCRRY